jgi:hypothetical protein
MKYRTLLSAAAAASLMAAVGSAHAATTIWTYDGPVTDGASNAKATITEGASSLTITLENWLVNQTSSGQSISGISIDLFDVPTGVSLFSSSGSLINIEKKTGAVTAAAGADAVIDHWGTGIGGGLVFLQTAGAFAVGGQPNELIVGAGPYTNANSSITNRNPHLQQSGTFVLNFTGLTGPLKVTGVNLAFGTDAEFHGATCDPRTCLPPPPGVPEPATWAMMLMGFFGLGSVVRRRRRAAFA